MTTAKFKTASLKQYTNDVRLHRIAIKTASLTSICETAKQKGQPGRGRYLE
jgi:hypothetical protein